MNNSQKNKTIAKSWRTYFSHIFLKNKEHKMVDICNFSMKIFHCIVYKYFNVVLLYLKYFLISFVTFYVFILNIKRKKNYLFYILLLWH